MNPSRTLMACTISSPSKISIYRANVVKYSSIKTKVVAPISCTASGDEWNIDHNFTPYTNLDELCMNHKRKLKEFKLILKEERQVFIKSLNFFDAIQRLGIDHHFQEEMELWRQWHLRKWHSVNKSKDLYQLSLYFRLIREEGYHVSPDMFLQFKSKEGNFGMKEQRKDVRALMALYEASQLSIKGEDILDETAYFSSNILNQLLTQVDKKSAAIISNTLKHPYHKCLTRLNAKNVSIGFEGIKSWESPLNELSNLELLIAQDKHRQELHQVFKWWKNVGLAKELKQARDQPIKWYTGPMGMLPDLSLSEERIELTKCISLIYIIDDNYDLYGNSDELALFTESVNRWELSVADELPDYMKKCFYTLYDITNEISYKIQRKHGNSINPAGYLRKSWARLCNAFLVERRWFDSSGLPKCDEYLNNGIISSGVEVVLVHLFFLLGLSETANGSMNLESVSGTISSVSTILRLWDDLGSAKDEDQNGHDGSYIACYMNEHECISLEVAREHVFQLIEDEWKQLNKECLGYPSQLFACFKKASLNLARMVPLMYSYDNNQRLPVLKEYINSMLYSDLLHNQV